MPTNTPVFSTLRGSARTALTTCGHALFALALGCQAFTPTPMTPATEASTSGAAASVEPPAALEPAPTLPAVADDAGDDVSATEDAPAAPSFFDTADAPILEALANERIVRIERGRGGRSIGFKVWFESGMRGYFKPEQSAGSTRWYAEIAAYHLDRELGLGRTAPSVVRTLPMRRLAAAAGSDARVDEIVARDGDVRGALIYWIPGSLDRAPLEEGWEHWVRVGDDLPAVDPFVAPPHFRRANRRARRLIRRGRPAPARAAPFAAADPDHAGRAAELSDLVVFDYLTANQDRWGGGYTNVRTRGEGGPVVYLDNGAGFRPGPNQRDALLDARIEAVERFRAGTLDAVRDLDVDRFAGRLEEAGVALRPRQLAGLRARRAHVLDHAAQLASAHGDAATPW